MTPKKSKPKSKAQKERDRIAKDSAASTARRQRAIDLHAEGWKAARIAQELNVDPATVARWLRDAGVPARPKAVSKAKTEAEMEESVFNDFLEDTTTATIADAKIAARDDEQQALLEVAENQSSPADKYQAYVAATGIRMLRDNMMNVRGPRTVRELSELDQLIRRSLGLNPKGGSGGGSALTIDISILNNHKADLGSGAIRVGPVIDLDNDED